MGSQSNQSTCYCANYALLKFDIKHCLHSSKPRYRIILKFKECCLNIILHSEKMFLGDGLMISRESHCKIYTEMLTCSDVHVCIEIVRKHHKRFTKMYMHSLSPSIQAIVDVY